VRLGQKLDAKRRADLLAKAEKMAVRMRESFLEIDTSGDSRLDPAETLAMFEGSEAALEPVSCGETVRAQVPVSAQASAADPRPPLPGLRWLRRADAPFCAVQEEIKVLQEFMWAGDANGDNEISYGEFVDRFGDFIAELRPGNVKEESHKAMAALSKSDLMTRLFKYKEDFLQQLAKASTQSMRTVNKQEIRTALENMKHLKLTDDEIEWITLAANTFGRERFDPVALIEAAAVKRGLDIDVANQDFKRGVAYDVKETKLDEQTLQEFKYRAKDLQRKVGPLIHHLVGKIGAKTGDSLQRAFRALDVDKTGVVSSENLVEGFKQFGMLISDQEAQDIVGACDINQDGHMVCLHTCSLSHTVRVAHMSFAPHPSLWGRTHWCCFSQACKHLRRCRHLSSPRYPRLSDL